MLALRLKFGAINIRPLSERTPTPEEIRRLLERCDRPSLETLALAAADLSDEELSIVRDYLEEIVRLYERHAARIDGRHTP
jgi:hypothetical protein